MCYPLFFCPDPYYPVPFALCGEHEIAEFFSMLHFSRYMVIFGCYIMHCAFDLEAVVDGGELWFL